MIDVTSFRRLFRIARVERDVADEIAFPLESRARDLEARGVPSGDARAIATREFGDVADARRELTNAARRRAARRRWQDRFDDVVQDARYAWRPLLAAPGLTLAVIVLVALGVGANAAVFSVANDLFLRPPRAVANPAGLRRLYLRTNWTEDRSAQIRSQFFYPAFAALAEAAPAGATLAAYIRPDSTDARAGTARFTVRASYVAPNFLTLLGAPVALGRTFDARQDPATASEPLAVISDALWRARFRGDPDVLGKSIEVAKLSYTVIGVTSPGFSGIDLDGADLWLPLATYPWMTFRIPWYQNWRGQQNTTVIARLTPAINASPFAAIATTVLRRGEIEHVERAADTTATVLTGPILESLGPHLEPSAQAAITTRLIGVAIVLLVVAGANVANLLLLRGERRRKEIALRLALGISRARLFGQLLLESVILATIGAMMAIAVGWWGGTMLRSALMPEIHWATSAFNLRIGGIAVALAFLTGVTTGLVPAVRGVRVDLSDALKSGAASGMARSRLRTGLMTVQGALSVVLLVGAGLFVRSLRAVQSTDFGYDVSRVAYGQVVFRDPDARFLDFFSSRFDEDKWAGLRAVAARLRATSNIEASALATGAPMQGYAMSGLFYRGGAAVPDLANRDPAILSVTPSYAAVSGLRVARGRWLRDDDRLGSESVLVVNETAARTYWPGRDAIGQCLSLSRADAPCATVVGVTHDAHLEDLVEPPRVEVFVPIAQQTGRFLSHPNTIIVRARPNRTRRALEELRSTLSARFPKAEPPFVSTIEQAHDAELRPWRLGAELFALFGALALVVATFGVYSAMAYAVNQRTRELGIRIAVGAPTPRLVGQVAVLGLRPLVAGLAVGLVLSLLLARFVAALLYATSPRDPFTLVAVSIALLVAGVIGMLVPVRRAVRVDPMTALRAE